MITCITQDKAGYIWIGTEYGLNKYDSYRFTNYLHDGANGYSIRSNNISVTVDNSAAMLAATPETITIDYILDERSCSHLFI